MNSGTLIVWKTRQSFSVQEGQDSRDSFMDLLRNQNDDSCPHPRPLSRVERGGMGAVTVETGVPPELLRNARRLRKNQTEAESLLWQARRDRKLHNWKFRRQHPISEGFILDFYCPETKVAVELDGPYHDLKDQMDYDEDRTKVLEEYGILVIRILNEEVLANTESVVRKIATLTSNLP